MTDENEREKEKYLDMASYGLMTLIIIPVLIFAFPFWLIAKIFERIGVLKV